MFDFTKYKSKCILCDTRILIPLFWGEGTVSHSKPVIGLMIHTEVSLPWRVNQCHHREREQQQFFPSAVPVSNETLFLPRGFIVTPQRHFQSDVFSNSLHEKQSGAVEASVRTRNECLVY